MVLTQQTKNSLHTLTAYRYNGLWVFDDEDRQLVKEPFVAGADIMFDVMSGYDKDDTISECTVVFSENPIPKYNAHVVHVEDLGEEMGDTYVVEKLDGCDELYGFEFWLCPALLKFFPSAPREVYVLKTKSK